MQLRMQVLLGKVQVKNDTLRETNITFENRPSQKNISFPTNLPRANC